MVCTTVNGSVLAVRQGTLRNAPPATQGAVALQDATTEMIGGTDSNEFGVVCNVGNTIWHGLAGAVLPPAGQCVVGLDRTAVFCSGRHGNEFTAGCT